MLRGHFVAPTVPASFYQQPPSQQACHCNRRIWYFEIGSSSSLVLRSTFRGILRICVGGQRQYRSEYAHLHPRPEQPHWCPNLLGHHSCTFSRSRVFRKQQQGTKLSMFYPEGHLTMHHERVRVNTRPLRPNSPCRY